MFGVKCLIGACIAALASAGASAQEAEKPQPTETLVVTATRIEKSVYDIPAAIDAVSGDELRAHRANVDLSEGVGRIPGIVVQNRYNYAQDLQVSSRGFGARAAFGVRGVRLLQDGIPLTMPDGQGQTGLFDLDSDGSRRSAARPVRRAVRQLVRCRDQSHHCGHAAIRGIELNRHRRRGRSLTWRLGSTFAGGSSDRSA